MPRDLGRKVYAVAARLFLASAILLSAARVVSADEVTSKGTVLRGKVTWVTNAAVLFAPEYGKGELKIAWKDIEDIKTDFPVQLFYGEDQETVAPFQGLAGDKVFVGQTKDTATGIDTASIFLGVPLGPDGLSFRDRMRSSWRYWDGHFDFGFHLQESTTDTVGFLIALETVRIKDPFALTLAGSYRYSRQTKKVKVPDPQPGDPNHTKTEHEDTRNEDQALGLIRGDYKFLPRWYAFASGDVTYDSIQMLSIRGVPKVGVGYIIWERTLEEEKRDFLQAEVGGGWVYEKFFGGEDDNFFAVAFGALAAYHLPYGSLFDWRFDFLPAVDDFTGDYLMRTAAGLTIPLWGPIDFRLGVRDEYDSTPANGASKNSFYFDVALSVLW